MLVPLSVLALAGLAGAHWLAAGGQTVGEKSKKPARVLVILVKER